MGIRHIGRKLAIQALYQASTRNDDVIEFIDESRKQFKQLPPA